MDDKDLLKRIETLVDEEHVLLQRKAQGNLKENEHERIRELEISLDQCWDLLRQRRARKQAGLNPDDAQVRDANTVEHYTQ